MSGGGTHVGFSSTPASLIGAVASGGLGALTSHSALIAPLVVRGGASPSLDLPAPPSLLKPGLAAALFPFEAALAPSFKIAAEQLSTGRRLVDLLGAGDCGPNCLAGGLVLLGLLPCSDDVRRGFCCHPRLIVPWGRAVRARLVAHARLPRVLSGLVAARGADAGGAPMPFAHAIMSSFASWPGLASTLSKHGVSFSVEGWLSLMGLDASGDRMGTYLDEAGLIAAADCFSLRITCHVVDEKGAERQGSPQIFLPLDGVAPRREITLWVQPDVHFVLEVAVLREAAAGTIRQSDFTATGLLDWRACGDAIHRLGGAFARTQGEALAARFGLSRQAAGMPQSDGGVFYAKLLLQLYNRTLTAPLQVCIRCARSWICSKDPPERHDLCRRCAQLDAAPCGSEGQECVTDKAEARADELRALTEEEELAQVLALSSAEADSRLRAEEEDSLRTAIGLSLSESQSRATMATASSVSQPPADLVLSEVECFETAAQALPAAESPTLAERLLDAEDKYEAAMVHLSAQNAAPSGVSAKRARTQRYIQACEQALHPDYRSACVLLFGMSSSVGGAAVLLVCYRAAPHAAQPISELRDTSDASAVQTVLRGIAEELLGLAEGSAAAAARVAAFSRCLDDAGFEARHLGANPMSPHRSFALPAGILFDGGIDGAFASFRVNAEMGSAALVPLRGLTGRPGETSVVDSGQRRHQLRGGRHLGEGRLTFIRRYLKRRGIMWGADEGPPPPPPGGGGADSHTGDLIGTSPSPSAAPRGGGGDDASPPQDDGFGDWIGASRAASLESEWAAAATREWQSFSWPLTSVAEVKRLLRCSHIAPTDIVGFEFSGAVRQALEAVGRRALSVDRRACDVGGMHAVLDVREVISLTRWRRAFLFPPCFQQLRADEDCLQAKIDDGRAFWGCVLVIWCFSAPADLLIVEQPDTIVADFLPLEFLETRTSAFGDSPDKYVRLYLHNCQLTPPFAPDPAARRRPPHYLAYPNSDARDRAKSTWRPFVSLCRALARLLPAEEPAPAGLDYASAVEAFAAAWHRDGHPVPRGYANPLALPPAGSRRYQLARGPGDGRHVDAVVPVSMMAGRPRGGAGEVAEEAPGGVDVRTATVSCALLLYVATLLQPLVYAHANGFSVQGVLLPDLAPRASYVRAAQLLVSAAIGAAEVAAFMVGEYVGGARLVAAPLDFRPPRHLICTSRAARLALLAAGGGWAWMTLAALEGSPVSDAAHRAVLACDAFVKPGHMLADFPSEALETPMVFRTGAATAVSVLSRPTLRHIASPPAWRAIAVAARDSQLLIDALNRASEDELLAGWVDRIKPLDPGDIPDALLRALPSFADEGLEHQPFSPLYRPLVTPWLPLPPLQAPVETAMPQCVRSPFEMMLPATQTLVVSWLRHTLRDLKELRDATAAGTARAFADGTRRRDRPRPLAVGRLELHLWARDRVWDCRAACCQLLNFRAPIRTHLNLEYLRLRLQTYPDQYLVANVLEGVRLDADVELQSVFVPHLVSLPLGYRSVAKELRRLHGLGWYAFFPDFPFWPLYLNGQGATARKLEPDRFRRTTEGGGPRQPTFDLEGLQALSINAASFTPHMPAHFTRDNRPEMRAWLAARGLPPAVAMATATAAEQASQRLSKWPKEAKPKLCELMHDLAILKRAAQILGVPVYIFGDDARDYFNQLAMAECELHKVNIVFLSEEGDVLARDADTSAAVPTLDGVRLIFVSELRLGFGTHGASNIAQRFSEALLSMFREDMDREELPFFEQPSTALQHWLTSRLEVARSLAAADCEREGRAGPPTDEAVQRHYLEQRRLWAAWCYTDDPVWIVAGVDRTLRALRVWRRLTDSVGLLMAIPEKRNLGVHATWLGVLIITALAIVVVPRGKLLRAAAAVSGALQGGQPFHVYRSLIGLLEHLRAVNLRGRNVMHGLYAPHRPDGASRFGPSGRVFCDELMLKQLQRWRELLQHSAGVSVRLAFNREQVEPAPDGITVHASSDACFGDPEPDGIGGFCHGLYWQFLVPPCDRDVLSTPVLEFLGVAFNIINFCEHAASLCGSTGTLLLTTDALTTALVLPRETQRSPIMIDAYQLLTETAAWSRLLSRLRVRHSFGETMFLADPLSRSRWHEFRSRCAQLGVRPHAVPLSTECRRIFDLVVQLERARRLAASRLAPALTAGVRIKKPQPSDFMTVLPRSARRPNPYLNQGRIANGTVREVRPRRRMAALIEEQHRKRFHVVTNTHDFWRFALPLGHGSIVEHFGVQPWHHAELPGGYERPLDDCTTMTPWMGRVFRPAHCCYRRFESCGETRYDHDPGWCSEDDDSPLAPPPSASATPPCRDLVGEGDGRQHWPAPPPPPSPVAAPSSPSDHPLLTLQGPPPVPVFPDFRQPTANRPSRRHGCNHSFNIRHLPPPSIGPILAAAHSMAVYPLATPATWANVCPQCEAVWRRCPCCELEWSRPSYHCLFCNNHRWRTDFEMAWGVCKQCVAHDGASFLERLKRPPPEAISEPNWLRRRLASAPAASEAPQTGFLQSLRQQPTPPVAVPPTPTHTVAAGLPLPTPPPRPPTAATRPVSSLQNASSHYAQVRARALAAGPDPSMRVRADVAELHRASESVSEISEFGTNSNTLRKDDRAWEFWEIICERLGTSPFRTAEEVRTNPERQAFLLAVLMLYASSVCIPKTAGRHCIKPRSALAYPLAIIRIFGRWGIQMPGFKALQAQLQGLQRAYIAYHGAKSLAPKRAEPMRFSMVRDINALKCDGTIHIKSRRWSDDDQVVFMFRRLNLLQMRGGWRLAEWVYHSSGEVMYICRSDLWWRIGGVIFKDPTAEQLRRLRPGDCAFVAPPRSKPDQSGEIHCSFPVVYVFNYEADNAAAALRDIELRHPCHGLERESRPVIADENGNPFTHSVLDTILHNVLVHLFGAAMASLFSWHSYRSGLCTALFAAGCPDALNQLICRWMCPESLHVYRRLGTLQNADWVERASNAQVDTIQSGNAPRVSNNENWGELFRETSRARGSPLMQDWVAAQADANTPARPPAATAARPAAAPAPAPAVVPAAVPPLTAASTVGYRVLVPAAVYPQYTCSERGGAGWECLVISATGVSAVVRFLHARAADGRPYADERLPLHALQPL